jgi:pyruvate formate lyase activating enzyme
MDAVGVEQTGVVFDIQRASLHDGPGIRTTVFLKGCPLNCIWCHNPEAQLLKPQLFFFAEKCTACGRCEQVCEHQVHRIENGKHWVAFERCDACGKCTQACSQGAVRISGTEMHLSEVMAEVLADRDFYRASGGGLTLSGGEPMTQFAFSLAVLQSARSEAIHTCMETAGYAPAAKFAEILPLVDLFLFDYKLPGSAEHRKYTGVPNELILENLDFLYRSGKDILLRCPIIPGINDTPEHFSSIARLSQKYPHLRGVELLPYHDLGNSKRTQLGLEMTLQGIKTVPPEVSAAWVEQLTNLGCEKARIG